MIRLEMARDRVHTGDALPRLLLPDEVEVPIDLVRQRAFYYQLAIVVQTCTYTCALVLQRETLLNADGDYNVGHKTSRPNYRGKWCSRTAVERAVPTRMAEYNHTEECWEFGADGTVLLIGLVTTAIFGPQSGCLIQDGIERKPQHIEALNEVFSYLVTTKQCLLAPRPEDSLCFLLRTNLPKLVNSTKGVRQYPLV